MFRNVRSRVVIIIIVVAATVFALFFAFPHVFGMSLIGAFMAEEKLGSSEDKITARFDDSSFIIENRSSHSSVHIFNDDIAVLCCSGPFMTDRIIGAPAKTPDGEYEIHLQGNRIDVNGLKRYGLSTDGRFFICFGKRETPEYTIFDVKNIESVGVFYSPSELYEALDEIGVSVPVWYTANGGVYPENCVWSGGDYRLVCACPGILSLKNGESDVFAGAIDRMLTYGEIVAFHITVGDKDRDLRNLICENPVLPETGKHGVYVVLDTGDGSYKLFDEKKEAKAYLESIGVKPDFEKVSEVDGR